MEPRHLHRRPGDIEEIRKAGSRAAGLTRQLLAFSRKQVFQPKVINMNDVVANMDAMLHRLLGEDIERKSVATEGLWNVKADPGQMEQGILNLAVNARDAMPGGGKITVETANVVLDESYARSHEVLSSTVSA
jgi:signal transduction histidine kinase